MTSIAPESTRSSTPIAPAKCQASARAERHAPRGVEPELPHLLDAEAGQRGHGRRRVLEALAVERQRGPDPARDLELAGPARRRGEDEEAQEGCDAPSGHSPSYRIARTLTLTAGRRLGTYEILSALGAGGMGEVWRATDTRLGRDVALKLLPAAFASDPDRLARFEREAKVLASLNHPGIAHLYGFESVTLDDGTKAHLLVMELAEGEDLAERLKRGPLPVDEAVVVARQIAEALEEAHDKGIVHRDLKPANVKLTPDGKVKVLDFGLAKAWEGPGAASSDLSQSPTLAHTGTAAGLILGTAAYMSPEQARGKAVDRRADIWAFGVVLFEMLTGRKLFEGETVSDVLAAVLTREPQWAGASVGDPGGVRRLLERCLERDPRLRLRDIGEARVGLLPERVVEAQAPATTTPPRGQRLLRVAPWLLALGLGVLAFIPRGGRPGEAPGQGRCASPSTRGTRFDRLYAFRPTAAWSLSTRRSRRRTASSSGRSRASSRGSSPGTNRSGWVLLVAGREGDRLAPGGPTRGGGRGHGRRADDHHPARRARAGRGLGRRRHHPGLDRRRDPPGERRGRDARARARAGEGPVLLARLALLPA